MERWTEFPEHEAYAAPVITGGWVGIGHSTRDGEPGVLAAQLGDRDGKRQTLPAAFCIGWRAVCECGWSGQLWSRHDDPDVDLSDGRSVVLPDPGPYAAPPAEVEEGAYREWQDHIVGPPELANVAGKAIAAAEAKVELDRAVAEARQAGYSWEAIGAQVGISRQSAWERWGNQ